MHPVLARYIDQEQTRELLRRIDAGEDVGEEHRALAEAAKAHPSERRAALKNPGKKLDAHGQQAVLALAIHAAVRALREDPKLSPAVAKAEAALREQEAEQDDLDALLAQLVADEAFGVDSEAGAFDEAWFKEGLEVLPRLTALDEEAVEDLITDFTQPAKPPDRPLRDRAARSLLEAAWSDGPVPINVEHLEDALDELSDGISAADYPKAAQAVAEFLELLGERKLLGPVRVEKLAKVARNAAAAGLEDEEEAEDDDDDEDGEDEH